MGRKTLYVELFDDFCVCCDCISMGKDYAVAVYGGNTPHAGGVVMSTVRPSLTGVGDVVTTSILNGIGHKDDVVAKKFAEAIALQEKCTVTCTCGIHVDNITLEQIELVKKQSQLLLEMVLKDIKLKEK